MCIHAHSHSNVNFSNEIYFIIQNLQNCFAHCFSHLFSYSIFYWMSDFCTRYWMVYVCVYMYMCRYAQCVVCDDKNAFDVDILKQPHYTYRRRSIYFIKASTLFIEYSLFSGFCSLHDTHTSTVHILTRQQSI